MKTFKYVSFLLLLGLAASDFSVSVPPDTRVGSAFALVNSSMTEYALTGFTEDAMLDISIKLTPVLDVMPSLEDCAFYRRYYIGDRLSWKAYVEGHKDDPDLSERYEILHEPSLLDVFFSMLRVSLTCRDDSATLSLKRVPANSTVRVQFESVVADNSSSVCSFAFAAVQRPREPFVDTLVWSVTLWVTGIALCCGVFVTLFIAHGGLSLQPHQLHVTASLQQIFLFVPTLITATVLLPSTIVHYYAQIRSLGVIEEILPNTRTPAQYRFRGSRGAPAAGGAGAGAGAGAAAGAGETGGGSVFGDTRSAPSPADCVDATAVVRAEAALDSTAEGEGATLHAGALEASSGDAARTDSPAGGAAAPSAGAENGGASAATTPTRVTQSPSTPNGGAAVGGKSNYPPSEGSEGCDGEKGGATAPLLRRSPGAKASVGSPAHASSSRSGVSGGASGSGGASSDALREVGGGAGAGAGAGAASGAGAEERERPSRLLWPEPINLGVGGAVALQVCGEEEEGGISAGQLQRRGSRCGSTTSTASSDVPACRICHESKNETTEALIAPCVCTGSARWVHATCLDRWRASAAAGARAEVLEQCEVCHTALRARPQSPLVTAWLRAQASLTLNIILVGVLLVLAGWVAPALLRPFSCHGAFEKPLPLTSTFTFTIVEGTLYLMVLIYIQLCAVLWVWDAFWSLSNTTPRRWSRNVFCGAVLLWVLCVEVECGDMLMRAIYMLDSKAEWTGDIAIFTGTAFFYLLVFLFAALPILGLRALTQRYERARAERETAASDGDGSDTSDSGVRAIDFRAIR